MEWSRSMTTLRRCQKCMAVPGHDLITPVSLTNHILSISLCPTSILYSDFEIV